MAEEDGVSLNNWISSSVAQKVGSVGSAAKFFASRAAKASGTGIMPFLTEAPEVPDDSQHP